MWKRSIELVIAVENTTTQKATESDTGSGGTTRSTKADAPPLMITKGARTSAAETPKYSDVISIRNNRIDFKYTSFIGAGADTLRIDIYNLDMDTVNTLLAENVKHITMLVGYEDQELSILMEGFISNVSGTKVIPEHVTSIWAVPKFQYRMSKDSKINKTIIKDAKLQEVINDLVMQMGFTTKPKFYNLADDIMTTPIRGYVFSGSPKQAMRDLGAQYGFFIKPTNNSVDIVARQSSTDSLDKLADGRLKMHQLNINKIKGNPQADVGSIVIRANLNPDIMAADILDCSNLISASGEGKPQANSIIDVNNASSVLYRSEDLWKSIIYNKYLIHTVVHTGSNFSNSWDTIITGRFWVKGTNNKKPGNGDPGFENAGADGKLTAKDGNWKIPNMGVHLGSQQGAKPATGPDDPYYNKWLPVPPVQGVGGYHEGAPVPRSEVEQDEEASYAQPSDYKGVSSQGYTPMPETKGKSYNRDKPPETKRLEELSTKKPSTISGAAKDKGSGTTLSPAWQNLAKTIGAGEGGDYNTMHGGSKKPLTNMTIDQVQAMQKEHGKSTGSSAAGKYQMITDTLAENANRVGLKGTDLFNEENQDKMFMSSITDKRDLGSYLQNKEDLSDEEVAERMAKEYAAVKQVSGEGYYDNDGMNRASIEAGVVLNALKGIQEENQDLGG